MKMNRLVVVVAMAVGAALTAAAMPTKAELQRAQKMVNDVTAVDVKALKAKSKTPAEVAAKHMELASQAGNEAEKYVLLQGAFKLYAKAGDYEGAANALGAMNREISDMNPEVIVEIYNKAIFSSMKEKAPKLHAIKEAARRQAFYRKQLAKAEAAVKANPKDVASQKKLGECCAELGDWPKALDAFALAGGRLAKTAEAEKAGTAAPQVSGDFWWDYESGDEMSAYKFHAAELYRTALADDSFKGLARTRTEQRVKEAEKVAVDLPRPPLASASEAAQPAVSHTEPRGDDAEDEMKPVSQEQSEMWFLEKGKAKWRVSRVEPPKSWLRNGFSKAQKWKTNSGICWIKETGSCIWMRTEVQWQGDPKRISQAVLWYDADDSGRVWLNGREIARDLHQFGGYKTVDITDEFRKAVQKGVNVFCAEVYNSHGEGQGDFGILLTMEGDLPRPLLASAPEAAQSTDSRPASKIYDPSKDVWAVPPSILAKCAWKVSEKEPRGNWTGVDYNDSDWTVVEGACWWEQDRTSRWLRRAFNLEYDRISGATIRIKVDDKCQVWLNGVSIIDEVACSSEYRSIDVTKKVAKAIKRGLNVLAVKCWNDSGHAECDVGLCLNGVALLKKGVNAVWFTPVSETEWRVSEGRPSGEWMSPDYREGEEWPTARGFYRLDRGFTTHWFRTEVDWKYDSREIERVEIKGVVNDEAKVWLNGSEMAALGLDYDTRKDITEAFVRAVKRGRNIVAAEFTNTHGDGAFDIGISVKLRSK